MNLRSTSHTCDVASIKIIVIIIIINSNTKLNYCAGFKLSHLLLAKVYHMIQATFNMAGSFDDPQGQDTSKEDSSMKITMIISYCVLKVLI